MATTKYKIKVETGDRHGADAKVSIVIIGAEGQTEAMRLHKWFHYNFKKGQIDEYTVKAKDVGSLLMIKLISFGGGCRMTPSGWLVNRVLITKDSQVKVYSFPCFCWVTSEVVIFEGKALLARDEQDRALQQQRKEEVQQRQTVYQWGSDSRYALDLPGFIDAESPQSLPKDVQFTESATLTLFDATLRGFGSLGLVHLFHCENHCKDFDEYRKCFSPLMGDVPSAANYWQDDVWYGSQFLNGCNPEMIERCTALPPNFPVTDELVHGLLDTDITLKDAMEAGRLYMVNYKILEGIQQYGENDPDLSRRHTSASMGLFYVRNNGDLVPIAIQLHQNPCDTNPIWTSNDSDWDWLFAKLWLRNADGQCHQMISHLLRCHLMMEPFAVASWRQLPSLHPVWKLLFPHIKGILAINTLGREKLISKGGVADHVLSIGGGGQISLMQKYYRSLTMESYDLPKMLKKRGVDEADKLPRFYYREDALKLWDAICEFVQEIIGLYYSSDNDVAQDEELQNWARDIHDNGFPSNGTSVDKGLPTSYKTRESLVHFLTTGIFTSSCQHAAVNFSQLDAYGFHPNSPLLMRKPPPVKKGEAELQHIMECLANQKQACTIVITVYGLTRLYPNEKFLGDYAECLFTDEAALKAISRFQENLKRISAEIKKRNRKLITPYEYLLPERIPNSIAI